jgi:hypothetical protein
VNDRQRLQLANLAANRLTWMARILDAVSADGTTVIGRIRDQQGGLRAKSFDGTGSSHRHDATFTQVIHTDQAVVDERELNKAIDAAARAATKAMEIVDRYPMAHRATDIDQAALGRLNARDASWCESCARTTGPAGGARCEPPRAALAGPTNVGGRLDPPQLLCDWCYQAVRRWGRVPTVDELERHHRGQIVAWPADVRRP